jgi:hypothetical protein
MFRQASKHVAPYGIDVTNIVKRNNGLSGQHLLHCGKNVTFLTESADQGRLRSLSSPTMADVKGEHGSARR